MSKRKKRIIIILSVVVFLVILARILLPRIYMWNRIKEIEPLMEPPAEAFTAYDVTLDNGQSVFFDGLTITIPKDYTLREPNDKYSKVYDRTGTNDHCIVISSAQDVSHMDLTDKENAAALMEEYFFQISRRNIYKGFKDLGYGNPDSAYNVYKAAVLLTADNYNFWNWQRSYAYIVSVILNETMFYRGDCKYIYETEDICGIVFYNDMTSMHHAYAYMFSTDDLNTMYTLSLRSISQEDIYGMLNSIVIE